MLRRCKGGIDVGETLEHTLVNVLDEITIDGSEAGRFFGEFRIEVVVGTFRLLKKIKR